MQFELASPADEPQLRGLLREVTLPGAIELSLEREPCINFANAVEGTPHHTIVARATAEEAIVAMGSRTIARRYINGEATSVAYLGQLRVARQARANPALLRGGYALLKSIHDAASVPWSFTTIVSDNRAARRVLEAGMRGLPSYEPVDELVTAMLPVAARRVQRMTSSLQAAPATPADVDDIVACLNRNARRYQFSRVWTREDLLCPERTRGLELTDFSIVRSNDTVVGCLACWDQRSFKQAVVRNYSRRLAGLRPLHNLLAGVTGAPQLPRIGTTVPFAWLSHLAVDDDDPTILPALLAGALQRARARSLEYVSLDLSSQNSYIPLIKKYFSPREYRSRLYVVRWPETGTAAGTAKAGTAAALDGRICHPEAATL